MTDRGLLELDRHSEVRLLWDTETGLFYLDIEDEELDERPDETSPGQR
jgi:hypothetical protein